MKRVVIIGGVAAGMSAASQLRRMKEKEEVEILVFEKGGDISYSACGIPYYLSGVVKEKDDLVARTKQEFEERNISVHLFHEVKEVNHTKKYIVVQNVKAQTEKEVTYDELIIATGTTAVKPNFMSDNMPNVCTLKSLADSERIYTYLQAHSVEKVTIIGGGYVGMEVAEAMKALGKEVRVIEQGKQILSILDQEMAEHLQKQLDDDILFHFEEEVEALLYSDGSVTHVQTNSQTYQTDLVIVNVGVRPNTQFLERNGLRMLENGAILVNEKLETNVPHIYAAGDCATSYHRVLKKDVHIALGTIANKQGRVLGYRLGGEKREFPGVVGTSIVKVMDYEIGKTGISEREARENSLLYKAITAEAPSHASYYPGAEKIVIKLVYHPETKEILGVQMIGKEGVSKRIDVFATAITCRLTTDEITMLDLSYAPPFATVWDAVQIAAQKAE